MRCSSACNALANLPSIKGLSDLSFVAWLEQVQQHYLITSMEDQNAHLLAAIRQHMREDPSYKVLSSSLSQKLCLSDERASFNLGCSHGHDMYWA
jgi:hypothetical protein